MGWAGSVDLAERIGGPLSVVGEVWGVLGGKWAQDRRLEVASTERRGDL